MEHIRDHLVYDHLTVRDIRPDFYFWEHLEEIGLATSRVLTGAKPLDEVPAPFVSGIYAHDFLPAEQTRKAERLQRVVVVQDRSHIRARRTRYSFTKTLSDNNSASEANNRHSGTCETEPRPNIRLPEVLSHEATRTMRPNDNRPAGSVHVSRVNDRHPPNQLVTLQDSAAGTTHQRHHVQNRSSADIELTGTSYLEEVGRGSKHATAPTIKPSADMSFANSGYGSQFIQADSLTATSSPSLQSSICLSESSSNASEELQPPVNQIKQEMVEKLIEYVTRSLQPQRADRYSRIGRHREEPFDQPSSSTSSYTSSSAPQSFIWAGARATGHLGSSKKRKLLDDLAEEEGTDEDEDDQHEQPSAKGKERLVAKFACPYYKNNPSIYKDRKNCCGPGWPAVHRVKEHLYRQHQQPRFRCKRCCRNFKDDHALEVHQREVVPCPIRAAEPIEGFDEHQMALLRSRKQPTPKPTEFQKWQGVYKILFPWVEEKDIPSPFYDMNEVQIASDQPTNQKHNNLEEVQLRVRQSLEAKLKPYLSEQMATDIIGEVLEDLAKRFSGEHPVESLSSELPPNPASVTPNSDEIPDWYNQSQHSSDLDGIDISFFAPFTDLVGRDFDMSFAETPQSFSAHNDVDKRSLDSGYRSFKPQGSGTRASEPM
ncbi:hypothetical protein BKA67DRAFT_657164 [Truncatella angustata]|uniref:C2H2-type domain-containing protein n=1 Tax=Truncatella angustata TaxID=152316 RepID=A0A9P8UN53_9PEZI|nr:uncharacterized protein BKA67DRAFT_657164 [Truncatella angustata]KAH6655215.1 hypothetical protein BKA67DRAFT_657164 [Truncatella angustata]